MTHIQLFSGPGLYYTGIRDQVSLEERIRLGQVADSGRAVTDGRRRFDDRLEDGLAGLRGETAGVVSLRARVWRGWRCSLPLIIGIWILVPTTPVLIVTGGPPSPLSLAMIAVWDVLWALTGAVVIGATAAAPTPATAAERP